ncbi:SDR family oxidoreductase [Caldibacillus debilis]|uniref:SDR family oxidoreductase n=1 Tax=Caldibacillus debilis TaxID=301148 RepID=UPI00058D220A|nr:SDR family oxidoreductase [Caldibacillus debilis]
MVSVKIALITGTSSGFGLLTALELAKKGYRVIATMRDPEKRHRLLELAEKSAAGRIEVWRMDVTKEEEIDGARKKLEDAYGKLDVLINNAGYATGGFFSEIEVSEWEKQFRTNFFGPVRVTRAFLPLIRKNGGGKIINISSVSGFFGFPGLGPYTASKHALEGFSESLRLELAPENIWVSLVEPAAYATDIWEKGLKNFSPENRPKFQQRLIKMAMKAGKTGSDPTEVARLIGKICDEEKPGLRYPVGKGARSLYRWKALLPWRLVERAVLKKLGG